MSQEFHCEEHGFRVGYPGTAFGVGSCPGVEKPNVETRGTRDQNVALEEQRLSGRDYLR